MNILENLKKLNNLKIKSGMTIKDWGENVKSRKSPLSDYFPVAIPTIIIVI